MDQKVQMIGDWIRSEYSITDLSEVYHVSRKTIYKWIERYELEGTSALNERPRAPWSHPNAIAAEVVKEIVDAKLRHQKWGPKKVLAWLQAEEPGNRWPVASTVGELLKRAGLVKSRRKKHRTPPYTEPFHECQRPNQVWSADFKGQFRTADGKLCYPLTITDNQSRYLLLCRGLSHPTLEECQPWFEWVFREYGLPEAIKTDNGAPFASVGLGGLSRLSIWFIKLGIKPERIAPGHPEQNGRHERMHRSLKEATAKPPRGNIQEQQGTFDEFVAQYNLERPHEALGQQAPVSFYYPSCRPYPIKISNVKYSSDVAVREVRHNGEIKWKGRLIYLSEALAGEPVGLLPKDKNLWEINFSFHPLGVLNDSTWIITPPTNHRGGEVLPMSSV